MLSDQFKGKKETLMTQTKDRDEGKRRKANKER